MSLKKFIIFALVLSLPGTVLGAGRVKQMDELATDILKSCKGSVSNFENVESMRKNHRSVEALGTNCWGMAQLFIKQADKLDENLKSDVNKRFASDSFSFLKPLAVAVSERGNDVRDDGERQTYSYGSLKGLRVATEKFLSGYQKFKANVKSMHEGLKREANDVSKEWNSARADDEVEYKKAMVELEKHLKQAMEMVKQGGEFYSRTRSTSHAWARASRIGNKKDIEAVYLRYYQTRSTLKKWEQQYQQLNERFEDIADDNDAAWNRFVAETKKSFQLYDGDVVEAQQSLAEFEQHILGAR